MPAPPGTPPCPLSTIVDALDGGLDPPLGDDPMLIRIRRPGTGFELGLLPVDPDLHPVDLLLGFRAGKDWEAVGVVAPGRAYRLDHPAPPACVRLIHVVDRAGSSASALRNRSGDERPWPSGEGGGLIDDCCRRALGLPTPPPARSPLVWWTAMWLERILAAALVAPDRGWCWNDLVRLHPLLDRGPVPMHPQALATRIRARAATTSWEALRAAASNRRAAVGGLEPAVWRWMDAGMFARWNLTHGDEPTDLLKELRALLPASQIGALTEAVDAWDTG